jgi:hypothetical protein
MTHCLKFASLLALCSLVACRSPYHALRPSAGHASTALRFRPAFTRELYRCTVDGHFLLKKFHISGLLLFRAMPDSSTRVVFQNEMGFSFFDFSWDRNNNFSVKQILPQLNKPAVIRTLEQDLRFLLMKGLTERDEQHFTASPETYHRFPQGKGYVWYVEEEGLLKRIEYAGRRKITTIVPSGASRPPFMPEAVLFRHHKARFTIQLQKISDATE